MLGFGIILPALPFRAAQLGGGGAWVGAIITSYAVAQFISAPVLGSLSDRYGRRRLLLLSLVGSAVSLTLSGVAGTLIFLLLARFVAGSFGGAIAVGQAYAVDLAEPRNRTRALGMVGASIGLGFVFGPAIGGGLSAAGVGFTGICLAAAVIARPPSRAAGAPASVGRRCWRCTACAPHPAGAWLCWPARSGYARCVRCCWPASPPPSPSPAWRRPSLCSERASSASDRPVSGRSSPASAWSWP
jgi:MFS family permease